MDNYQFYLPARVRCFESSEQDSSSLIYSSGASVGLGDGDLDSCTSCDSDDVTFSFHTYLAGGLDLGSVGSFFTNSLGCPSSSHSFFGD